MKLSVLHLVAPCEAGGLERVVRSLAAGHRRAGHRVGVAAVLAAPQTEHPLLDELEAEGVEVFACPVPPRAYFRERAMVREVIGRFGPEVVHTHGYRPDVLDGGLSRRAGIPTVSTVHGFTGGDWKNRTYEWLQCRAFRRFDGVVAVSRPLREHLIRRGVPAGRVHVVPNAWGNGTPPEDRDAARARLNVPDGRFHLGWVGRLSAEKGADVLVEAMPYLRDLPLHLSMIGYGPELPGLRRRAADLGVDGAIGWHDGIRDAGRLFTGFDAFVLSSRTEGTPIVLFEAMAVRTPIVATRVGGVPDVVSGSEAILVRSEEPAALAAAIREAYSAPDAALVRARAAHRRLVAHFSLEPWLARYEELYRALQPSTS
jgi:glycosyltransferase involved in cell wall biosynthesis